jgi:hypothetical protein
MRPGQHSWTFHLISNLPSASEAPDATRPLRWSPVLRHELLHAEAEADPSLAANNSAPLGQGGKTQQLGLQESPI